MSKQKYLNWLYGSKRRLREARGPAMVRDYASDANARVYQAAKKAVELITNERLDEALEVLKACLDEQKVGFDA